MCGIPPPSWYSCQSFGWCWIFGVKLDINDYILFKIIPTRRFILYAPFFNIKLNGIGFLRNGTVKKSPHLVSRYIEGQNNPLLLPMLSLCSQYRQVVSPNQNSSPYLDSSCFRFSDWLSHSRCLRLNTSMDTHHRHHLSLPKWKSDRSSRLINTRILLIVPSFKLDSF